MKVLLVSEGKHERVSLPILIERIAGTQFQFEHARLADENIPTHHGKGQGFLKKALRWLLKARDDGHDALILVVDHDGYDNRPNEIAEAQDEIDLCTLPRALGVAIRSFDAWMLADEVALSNVLGCSIARQRDPESISRPKELCVGLLARSSEILDQSTMYSRSAEILNLGQLAERCPNGFKPFADRVRALKKPTAES